MTDARKEYERWLGSPAVDNESKNILRSMAEDENAIASCFTSPLQFGTAGLRGIMSPGIGRMNVYTVAWATEGVARIVEEADGKERGVVIAHDSRINSRLFAETAAEVLAYHGIKTYIFDSLRPTPELSFAVLHLGCIAGINVTASHNPKEYNGYKVYWSDGAQLPPEHALTVSAAMAKCDVLGIKKADFKECVKNGSIYIIGSEVDEAFISAVLDCRIRPEIIAEYGNGLSLMYTPLHGTGYKLVPEVLKRAGITNLRIVKEQEIPDGNFPTVASPNPEYSACFEIAENIIKADNLPTNVIIATDPDGDRLGVDVRQRDGSFKTLNGNQIGCILVDYLIKARTEAGKLPKNAAAIRSAVSSDLFDRICRDGGVEPVTVLTGFKYIGEKIKEYAASGEHTFIFGYEESQGFLSGGYVRDKDAVAASLLIAEAAAFYASKGKTLSDALCDIYAKYGFHKEYLVSVNIGGAVPMEKMKAKMAEIRSADISSFASQAVTEKADYKTGKITDIKTGKESSTGLPVSDMLSYKTEAGTRVLIRPSGTEPKVKAYILTHADTESQADGIISAIRKEIAVLFE